MFVRVFHHRVGIFVLGLSSNELASLHKYPSSTFSQCCAAPKKTPTTLIHSLVCTLPKRVAKTITIAAQISTQQCVTKADEVTTVITQTEKGETAILQRDRKANKEKMKQSHTYFDYGDAIEKMEKTRRGRRIDRSGLMNSVQGIPCIPA